MSTHAGLTWLGHSTVVIDLDGIRVVTDPVLTRRVAHLWRTGPAPHAGPADIVAVSHLHWDHFHKRSLARVARNALLVVPEGSERRVAHLGAARVVGVKAGTVVEHGGITLQVTRAEHTPDAVGYLLAGSRRVYFAGDTDVFDGMREFSDGLDVALVPIAGWGRTVPAGHLDAHGAVQALELLRPRVAIPIHWGTFAPFGVRALSTRGNAVEDFEVEAAQRVPEVTIHVLEPGGSVVL